MQKGLACLLWLINLLESNNPKANSKYKEQ